MRQIEHSWEELWKVPIGETVAWGRQTNVIRVVARAWGEVLVNYPFPTNMGHSYYGWSYGGGHSFNAKTDSEAIEQFDRSCAWTKDFWEKHLASGKSIIVKGTHYVDGGFSRDQRGFLGFGGSRWVIEDLKTKELWMTNNLWHQGLIPEEIRPPDTHRFIDLATIPDLTVLPTRPVSKGLPPASLEQQRFIEA